MDDKIIMMVSRNFSDNVRLNANLDPMKYIEFSKNLLHNKKNCNTMIVMQVISNALYIATNCFINEFQFIPKNIIINLIKELISFPSFFEITDFLISSLTQIIDPSNKFQMDYLLSMIEDDYKNNDSSYELVNKVIENKSDKIGIKILNLSYETLLKILIRVYESLSITPEKKLEIKNSFFNKNCLFLEETFIEDFLNACLSEENV